jgi:hypothetical protein
MNTAVGAPTFTGLDAVTQGITGLLYLIVGLAAWLTAPRDVRTRVFLGIALASVTAFGIPAAAWISGTREVTELPRTAVVALSCAFGIGGVLLFHFCQVFPRRRPWIERWGRMLTAAYVITPIAILSLVLAAPSTLTEASTGFIISALVAGVPLIILLTVVLPVAGIVSLVKSYRDARGTGYHRMRTPLLWMLVSQIAGGTIALVFAPVLATVAPGAGAQTTLTVAAGLLGLMTPIAFALAVWKYRLPGDYLT